jgi:hypothetical protein
MAAMGSALFVMVTSSRFDQQTALVETELRRYSEAIRAAEYDECADETASYAPAAVGYLPDPAVAAGLDYDVRFWYRGVSGTAYTVDPTQFVPAAPSDAPAAVLRDETRATARPLCDPAAAVFADDGLQEISIVVTHRDSPGLTASTTLLKRR